MSEDRINKDTTPVTLLSLFSVATKNGPTLLLLPANPFTGFKLLSHLIKIFFFNLVSVLQMILMKLKSKSACSRCTINHMSEYKLLLFLIILSLFIIKLMN